jgi:hypothetical protein
MAAWEATEGFKVIHTPVEDRKPTAQEEGWTRLLTNSFNSLGKGCVLLHTRQANGRVDYKTGRVKDDAYATPVISNGEATFTFTLLKGTVTKLCVGVAAADDSNRVWGIKLFNGQFFTWPPEEPMTKEEAYKPANWGLNMKGDERRNDWSKPDKELKDWEEPMQFLKAGSQGGGRPLVSESICVRVNMAQRFVSFSVSGGMPVVWPQDADPKDNLPHQPALLDALLRKHEGALS